MLLEVFLHLDGNCLGVPVQHQPGDLRVNFQSRLSLSSGDEGLGVASSGRTCCDCCSFFSLFEIPVKFPPRAAVNHQFVSSAAAECKALWDMQVRKVD